LESVAVAIRCYAYDIFNIVILVDVVAAAASATAVINSSTISQNAVITRSSAIAEGPRDAPCHLPHSCTKTLMKRFAVGE